MVKHAQLADGTIQPSKMGMVSDSIWKALKSLPEFVKEYGPTIVELASLLAVDDQLRPVAPITTFTLIGELSNLAKQLVHFGALLPSQMQVKSDIDNLIRILWTSGPVISFEEFIKLFGISPNY